MIHTFKTVAHVARWRLCLGCGVCAYICPDRIIDLVDVINEGIRPFLRRSDCGECRDCLKVCPAYTNDHRDLGTRPGIIPVLWPAFGPVLEIWEGHAADPEIRFRGSSGGALTALALYGLEQRGMAGVLQTGPDPRQPLANMTRLSRSRAEILAATGSRYAPASVCDGLQLIEQAAAPCVFIGQPSEVTALRNAQRMRPALDRNVGFALSFFCAGSPATRGTLELLRSRGLDPAHVETLRYRGHGWPGFFSVTLKGQAKPALEMSYPESWGVLQAYRPYSTHLCPDGTGEDADIACGDPWYQHVEAGDPGLSLVVVRTDRGREIVRGAIAAGYLKLSPAEPWKLLQSQQNLVNKRAAIWGRLLAFRLFGLPAPRLRGFFLFQLWIRLPLRDKLRSTLGTARRIFSRKYYRSLRLQKGSGS